MAENRTAEGAGDQVRDVTVLGFGTCVAGTAKGRLLLDNMHGDCWLGLNVASREMPVIRDCSNGGLLAPNPLTAPYR